ncbi:MAG: FliI/YscN family ATPase [Leptospirales bacterium]|nr:FliI/YscN family ATPase [Leptospirales bacterium]
MAILDAKDLTRLEKYRHIIDRLDPLRPMGRVTEVRGLSLVSDGPPDASIGDICRIELKSGEFIKAEVVGFQKDKLILMPLGSTSGISPGADVLATGRRMQISVSDRLLGRVFDALGHPLDLKESITSTHERLSDAEPPPPHLREPIRTPLETGVKAIDSLLTIGRGQRIGIFAGTGVGKSTLLGMICRYTRADVNVICLVGERGREVREFIETDLGEGLEKSVVLVAESHRTAIEKVYCAGFATSIAEYFRDQGKHVNLIMDSLTRYCWALRDIGTSTGEMLGPGGFPPNVWFRLSRLVERAGALQTGSITGFYSVLVEGDDMNDPVADHSRGMLDGHIVLSRRLAQRGHYPAIEVTESISRLMDKVITPDHLENANHLRAMLAAYRENEEIITLGGYARGSNPDVDEALEKMPGILSFLKQRIEVGSRMEDTVAELARMIHPPVQEDTY